MSESIQLYRYMDPDAGLKSIEARRFKVGRLKDFNDPFEWRIGISGIIPEGEILARGCIDSFIEDVHSWMGIICFSDTVARPVLWSHYAANHRSVAFEVNYRNDPDRLHRVQYSDDRPVFDANRLHDPNGLDGYLRPLLMRMIFQKSRDWSYESEYRVHIELAACEIQKGHFFQRIPDHFLSRVILGFRCPLEETYVRKALDQSGLKETAVVRAKMDEHTYTIRC